MNSAVLGGDKVKAINEIYHDLEAEYYEKRHPEIYVEEKIAWEKIGEAFIKSDRELTVLDIGTGAGFVPLLLSRYLKENDKVVCTDLSDEMLKTAEKKMASLGKIRKEFIKADALEVSNMGIKADIITMNSVLHHIPDYELVLPRLAKLVNKGGYFIIMHERNRLYPENRSAFLFIIRNFAKANILLRGVAKKILFLVGIRRKMSAAGDEFNRRVYQAVNEKKFFEKLLTIEEINAIVDIHDPDEKGDGFDPFIVHKKFFPDFEIALVDTYKHLGAWVNENSNLINKLFSKKIRRDHPYAGALFFLVMRKR